MSGWPDTTGAGGVGLAGYRSELRFSTVTTMPQIVDFASSSGASDAASLAEPESLALGALDARGRSASGRGVVRRLPAMTTYVLAGFPLSIVSFTVLITGLSLGAGLLVVFVGVFVLAGTLAAALFFADVERGLLSGLLDRRLPEEALQPTTDQRPIRWSIRRIADAASWWALLHGLVTLPISSIAFAMVVAWWAMAVGGTTWWLWGWLVDVENDLPLLFDVGLFAGIPTVLLGLMAALTLPWAVASMARLRQLPFDLLVALPAAQRHRIDDLVEGRNAGRAAEESALRRLERDIHDGPQQRLVRLSMDLGRAQHRLQEQSPELAAELGTAKEQAQETLAELRALSRGIAPPILADRGLEAALRELAARSTVPTGCVVDLRDRRLPSHIETAAYFVVAEALANVAKHSNASMATVVADVDRDTLVVEVGDDGVGGAAVAKGQGLAGLEQRLRAVDGRLDVRSPIGGPTSISAVIRCGS